MATSSRLRRSLAVLTGALLAVATAQPATAQPAWQHGQVLYVSPYGDDNGSGTLFRPLRTLQRAQQVVRTLDTNMTGDITVELLPGTYRLTSPLQLGAADSGTNGHTVTWTAAPGAHPVISGGQQLTGWHLTDPAKNIWSAPAPAGLRTRQLYVNGVRADRASGALPATLTATATGYTMSNTVMDGWRNPSGIEFVYSGGAGYWSLHTGGSGAWTEPRCDVASITGTTITMTQPCWDNSNERVLRTDGSGRTVELVGPRNLGNGEVPAYVENAYELLDQPGQWYLDQATHTVSYIPRQGENLRWADVEAPVLQQLVTGQGTATAPVHDITFAGIQFSYATWLTPSTPEGFSEIQANYTITGPAGYATQGLCQFVSGGTCPYGDWTKLPGNLSFGYDQHIQLTGDTFAHLGAAGVDLGDGIPERPRPGRRVHRHLRQRPGDRRCGHAATGHPGRPHHRRAGGRQPPLRPARGVPRRRRHRRRLRRGHPDQPQPDQQHRLHRHLPGLGRLAGQDPPTGHPELLPRQHRVGQPDHRHDAVPRRRRRHLHPGHHRHVPGRRRDISPATSSPTLSIWTTASTATTGPRS